MYFVQEWNDRPHTAHARYNISCYSPFINAWSVCILCRNERTACTLHTLDTASRDTLPLKTPDPCAFCAGTKWPPAPTLHTLDTASRDTLPLKTPDLCAFCAGTKWPLAQCTSMKGTTSVRDVTTTSTKLRYPANLLITIQKLCKVESKCNFLYFRIMDLQQDSRAWKKGKNIEKLLYQK